jgi:mono/diheme cytochrome c family protein
MMKTTWAALAAIMTAIMATGAAAADVEHGEKLARQWCANCHVIGGEQTAGGDAAAERTNDLRAWLADPHPPMPNLSLTRWEIDDLLAYIESLSEE